MNGRNDFFFPRLLKGINIVMALILLGLYLRSLVSEHFYGLHLNHWHRLVFALSVLLLSWAAITEKSKISFGIDLSLSAVFLISAMLGLLLGLPLVMDEMFAVVKPHVLDWSLKDFIFHGILGFTLLFCSLGWLLHKPTNKTSHKSD